MKAIRVLLVVCALCAITATLYGQYGLSTSNRQDGLAVSISTNRQKYSAGEPVDLTVTLYNNGNSAVNYQFTSAPIYDIWVTGADGKEVWRFSKGKTRSERSQLKIEPGDFKTYTEVWNQKGAGGDSVAPGWYEVYAKFAMDQDDKIVRTRIRIEEKASQVPMVLVVPVAAGTIDTSTDLGKTISIQGVLQQGPQGLYVETRDVKVHR